MDGCSDGRSDYKWDGGSSNATILTANPRTPGGFYRNEPRNGGIYKTFPATAKVIMGFGVYTNSSPRVTFYADGGTVAHLDMGRSADGRFEILRGGTSIAIGGPSWLVDTWYYIEMSATISDTVGEVHVRFNGNPVDDLSFIGDTKNAGTASLIDRLRLYHTGGLSAVTYFSDIYINNGDGTSNNDFLGDIIVKTLRPNGNGTYSDFIGSDGNQIDNFSLVNEATRVASSYVGSNVIGSKDSYQMENLPVGAASVFALQVNAYMLKNDVNFAEARFLLRSAGVDSFGTNHNLTTSAVSFNQLYNTNPVAGTAWTPTTVNDLEIGVEVV